MDRTHQGNADIFAARVVKDNVSQGMLSEFVGRVFDGAAVSLLLNFVDSEQIDPREFTKRWWLINRQAKEKQ